MDSSQAEILVNEKRNYLVFVIIGLLSIPVLFYFDTPIWQAARDLVEPDYLYIPEFFTHYGLYFFYFGFAVYGGYAFITKDRKRLKFFLAYIKAQLIFSLVIVRGLKTVLGRSRPG